MASGALPNRWDAAIIGRQSRENVSRKPLFSESAVESRTAGATRGQWEAEGISTFVYDISGAYWSYFIIYNKMVFAYWYIYTVLLKVQDVRY